MSQPPTPGLPHRSIPQPPAQDHPGACSRSHRYIVCNSHRSKRTRHPQCARLNQLRHNSLLSVAINLFALFWFETYVQQLVVSPLSQAGWPLIASATLIALTAGFLNHHLANGFVNGVACADFYWSVSLMFSLSNSVLPVTIYHTLSTRSGADLSWHTHR